MGAEGKTGRRGGRGHFGWNIKTKIYTKTKKELQMK